MKDNYYLCLKRGEDVELIGPMSFARVVDLHDCMNRNSYSATILKEVF